MVFVQKKYGGIRLVVCKDTAYGKGIFYVPARLDHHPGKNGGIFGKKSRYAAGDRLADGRIIAAYPVFDIIFQYKGSRGLQIGKRFWGDFVAETGMEDYYDTAISFRRPDSLSERRTFKQSTAYRL